MCARGAGGDWDTRGQRYPSIHTQHTYPGTGWGQAREHALICVHAKSVWLRFRSLLDHLYQDEHSGVGTWA